MDNPTPCRSEPARDEPENAAGHQAPSVIVDAHREHARSYIRGMGSTNRPSVSAPALDLDPPAPIGRLSGGVHPGIGAQRRGAKPHTLHVGAAKQTGGQCPRMNAAAKVRRALARGRTLGARPLLPLGWAGTPAFAKGSRPSGRNHQPPLPQQWICTQSARATSAIRPPSLAGQLPQELGAYAKTRSSVRPPSRASPLPQWIESI